MYELSEPNTPLPGLQRRCSTWFLWGGARIVGLDIATVHCNMIYCKHDCLRLISVNSGWALHFQIQKADIFQGITPWKALRVFPEIPLGVQLKIPMPYDSKHLKPPEHFQNSLPLNTGHFRIVSAQFRLRFWAQKVSDHFRTN